jgi:putative oxidoreductase
MATLRLYDDLTARLRAGGDWVWPLVLRLIMFWEFWESGTEKFGGSNWFSGIQDKFPFPFSHLSAEVNWFAATWGELVFSILILLGLFTRFAAFSLIIITVVATVAVHWPAEWSSLAELWKGYAITGKGFGNYKLPLLFAVILLPLVFNGGGKISLDYLILKLGGRDSLLNERTCDLQAAGWTLAVMGMGLVFLIPVAGIVLLLTAALSLTASQFLH